MDEGDQPAQPRAEILLEKAGSLTSERRVCSGQVLEAGARGNLYPFKAFGRFWFWTQDSWRFFRNILASSMEWLSSICLFRAVGDPKHTTHLVLSLLGTGRASVKVSPLSWLSSLNSWKIEFPEIPWAGPRGVLHCIHFCADGSGGK